MDRLFKKLDAIGLGFEEGAARYLNKFYGKNTDMSIIGFLHNQNETPMTTEKLTEVEAVAKSKQTYCIVMPEIATSKRGALVCFLQYGLLDAAEIDAGLVSDSLRQNFSYLQEEEQAIKLDAALQRFLKSLEDFREKVYEQESVLNTSRLLRRAINEEGRILTHDKGICAYTGDVFEIHQAETLCNAIHCLQVAE
jgi:hypothetical protein